MQIVSKLALNLLWIGAAVFILAASAASAQTYPPDVQEVTAEADDPTPEPGSTTNVTATVLDDDGNPVEGAVVTFTLTSNPGGATFSNGQQTITAATDANGVATVALNTGAEPGTIVVRVDANGVVTQVTLTSGDPQALPKTGGAPGASSGGVPIAPAFAGGALVLFLAAGAFVMRKFGVTAN